MLKSITIDNYKTFKTNTVVDFYADKSWDLLTRDNTVNSELLKGALFVGENASGKTQILNAIRFILELLVLDSSPNHVNNLCFYSKKQTYSFEYIFDIKQSEIKYSIKLNPSMILSETLTVDNEEILSRNKATAHANIDNKKIKYSDMPNQLPSVRRLYFDTYFNNNYILNKWMDFLRNSIYFNSYERRAVALSGVGLLPREFAKREGVSVFNDFFTEIGYAQTVQYSNEAGRADGSFSINSANDFISFMKNGTDVYIPDYMESLGNVTLMHLIPSFKHAVKHDCMLIVDEFSSGLHNKLEECLLKYFFSHTKCSQIFFASHSTNLLNTAILRPEQVFITSFQPDRGTILERMPASKMGFSQNMEKMYLNGALGHVPRYGEQNEN